MLHSILTLREFLINNKNLIKDGLEKSRFLEEIVNLSGSHACSNQIIRKCLRKKFLKPEIDLFLEEFEEFAAEPKRFQQDLAAVYRACQIAAGEYNSGKRV